MTGRIRIATAGPPAVAADYADNPAIGKMLRAVAGAFPASPLEVSWQDGLVTPARFIYVDPNATGLQNGSIENPFSTFAAAVAVGAPNSIFCASPGTYHEDVHLTSRQNLVCRTQLSSPTSFPVTEGAFWPIVIDGDIFVDFPGAAGAETVMGIADVFARDVHITTTHASTSNSLRCRRCWFRDVSADHMMNVRVQGSCPPYAGNADCAVRSFLGGTIDVEAVFMYWGLGQDGTYAAVASDVNDFQLIESFLAAVPQTVIVSKNFSNVVNSIGASFSGTGVPNIDFTLANKTLQVFGWSTPITVSGPGASIGQSGVFWNNPLSNLAFTVQAPVAVVGAKAGNAALTSLCAQLSALGVIRDNTT